MKKLLVFAIWVSILSSCASVENEARLTETLLAKQYNSITKQFENRPTFLSLESISKNEESLTISFDHYGAHVSKYRFLRSEIDSYIASISKFISWQSIALRDGDLLTKEIARVKSWSFGVSAELVFTFHSGNKINHYLDIVFCTAGSCFNNEAMSLDIENAIKLKETLITFQKNKLKKFDSSKYK